MYGATIPFKTYHSLKVVDFLCSKQRLPNVFLSWKKKLSSVSGKLLVVSEELQAFIPSKEVGVGECTQVSLSVYILDTTKGHSDNPLRECQVLNRLIDLLRTGGPFVDQLGEFLRTATLLRVCILLQAGQYALLELEHHVYTERQLRDLQTKTYHQDVESRINCIHLCWITTCVGFLVVGVANLREISVFKVGMCITYLTLCFRTHLMQTKRIRTWNADMYT